MSASCSVTLITKDKDGNIIKEETISSEPEPTPRKSLDNNKNSEETPKGSIRYFFNDWSGNEDVIALSGICLKALEDFTEDGLNKGFLID